MTTLEFLEQLQRLGVKLWVEGERLRYRGSKEALTPALLAELAARKADLLALLRAAAPSAHIPRAALDGPQPLSFAQQRLWFLDQLLPNAATYHLPIALRLTGTLDVAALRETLSTIVSRHAALRTTVGRAEGEPVQLIAPAAPQPLQIIDLQTHDPAERETAALRLVAEEIERPFDLGRGPLLRTTLIQLGPREHMLLLLMHHIIGDGWSLGVLVQEVAALYPAYASGRPALLPELPIQYADYAVWQRQWMAGDLLDREIAYWRERLADAPPTLELPTDRPRPALQTSAGATHSTQLPHVLAELKAIGEREGATLFMTLLAAFYTLLYRYSGQTDLVVGTPIANRTRPELEPLIGFFVNTLALRADLSGNPRFVDLLQQVRRVTLDAYAHQDLPFEKLVEALQPERDMRHTPFFQVMFVLQNLPLGALELPDLTLSPLPLAGDQAKFDLTLALAESGPELSADIEYNTDLFDQATIADMAEHWRNLLSAIAADPQARIDELPLLSAAERERLLYGWNATATDYPRDATIPQLFEAQAARTPEAIAVVFEGARLTYRELNERANQLAHYLQTLGVGPERRVGLGMERSLDLPVALLAILKAGGAYVPLDLAYPRDRLQFMLDDAQIAVVLTHSAQRHALPADGVRAVCLDAERAAIARMATANPACRVDAEHLAYICYTSGSTGAPKGVSVMHRSVARLVCNTNYVTLTPEDRLLQFAPVAFDAATFEIWGALLNGAQLVIFPPEQPTLHELGAFLERERITTLWLTAGLFHQMVDQQLPALRYVRQLLAGGDVLSAPHVQRVVRELPETQLINGYGPTENTTFTCCYPVRDLQAIPRSVPIGRPISNTQVYILDERMEPQPIGVAGELYIGGDGLARDYLHRPDLTAERFVPNPFLKDEGGRRKDAAARFSPHPSSLRLYKTGDLARYRRDGAVEFIGRLDQQIKLRGFRVELGEIEAALQQHPAVRAAAVIAREDGAGGQRLTAYVVGEQRTGHTEQTGGNDDSRFSVLGSQLRAFLAQRLPDYMIPSAFVTLDALPLTPNGKVDRRALPAPAQGERPADQPFVAPRTPTETLLANIWAEVLGIAQVSADDHFFALGGHSLLATQLISRVRDAFNADLSLRDLFETLTVAGLAERIDAARQQDRPSMPPVEPTDRTQPLPLSFAQQRFWLLNQLLPDSPAYNITVAVRLTGALDPGALQRSLHQLVQRHEILRTTFVQSADAVGAPLQIIAPAGEAALPLLDWSATPADERAQQLEALLAAEAQRPFDLARGPLLRTTLIRQQPREHVLVLALHHIITDGWSMTVLVRELAALYRSLARPDAWEPTLPELPIQYGDYAIWQRQWMTDERLATELAYWRHQLGGPLPTLDLPLDHPRPAVQSFRGGSETITLEPELADALKALSRREGATLYMTLLAAFDVLLYRYTGQTDLLVGTPIAGRIRPELEGLIGLFLNTLVLRADLEGAPPFSRLLQQVRETTLQAFDHQITPFERLVEALQPERSLRHTPIFQVMFNLLNFVEVTLDLPDLQLSLSEPPAPAKFDLTLTMAETDEGLIASFGYNADLFEAATIARMARQFETLLQGIVAEPSRSIAALPLLPPGERERVLHAWNSPADPAPTQLVAQRFEVQAAHTPDAVALISATDTLSYAELNARANQLARRLQEHGIGAAGRETRVGLVIERSWLMVAAVLATLKAGGAYVPLDPRQPAERLIFMLDDAAIDLALTEDSIASSLQQLDAEAAAQDARPLTIVNLEREWPQISQQPAHDLAIRPDPEQIAYIMYTSGSTGQPKGVAVPQRAMTNYVQWMQQRYPLTPGDRVLQTTPLSFDVSVREIFWPLLSGAQLVLARPGGQSDIRYLVEAIERCRITQARFVPAMLQIFLDQPDLQRCATLRRVFCGGERLPADLAIRFRRTLAAELHNTYGPTEAAVNATAYACALDQDASFTPLGEPVANVQVYVLDADLEPVPLGVAGALCIGGAGLARGYWNRPALTAERFTPDPYGGQAGARLYRTGDLVRRHADGNLEFLGRLDQQIKLRGFRVELGEIESVLRQHPAVQQAAVIAREDGAGGQRLTAYVVGEQRTGHTEQTGGNDDSRFSVLGSQLRAFLVQRLPDYMIPSAFVTLDALPLTPNGKVDRRALPAPEPIQPDRQAAYVAPRTPTETLLANIWAEVLGLERVGIHDHFFELGGHSLLALQVVSRIRQAAGVEAPLQAIFTTPTIAALAQHIDVIQWAATSRVALPDPAFVGEEGEL
jgi:amino acid adenylation domain-containing protein